MPDAKVLTVLQNVDALYWRAAGERADKVEAVRVNDDVLCVFNATPLEKYESYRLFLDQWSRCDGGPDFAPTIYNLIDSLARFLEINRYSPHNGTQPKFLVDMLPEVYGESSDAMLRRLLSRKGSRANSNCESMLASVEERGSAYLPQVNAFYVREFQMMHAAEDATRFLHHACQGSAPPSEWPQLADAENSGCRQADRRFLRARDRTCGGLLRLARALSLAACAGAEDSPHVVARRLEKAAQGGHPRGCEQIRVVSAGLGDTASEARSTTLYLAGKVKPSGLRRLFLAHLDEPGQARKVCAAVIAKLAASAHRASTTLRSAFPSANLDFAQPEC